MVAGRNYNAELDDLNNSENEKYAYSFDFDVLHPYMIKSFEPFFNKGSLLELGSYQGQLHHKIPARISTMSHVSKSQMSLSRKPERNWATR